MSVSAIIHPLPFLEGGEVNTSTMTFIRCPICGCMGGDKIRAARTYRRPEDGTPDWASHGIDGFGFEIEVASDCGHLFKICIVETKPAIRIYATTVRVDYHEYIKSEQWRQLADYFKSLAGYRCRICNRHADEVTLDAHHRTYEHLGNEIEDDITILCRDCHSLYENARKSGVHPKGRAA